jgi:fermentation-respiration switch protein FrsA (DUF1100 family)
MRARRVIRNVVFSYAVFCAILAIFLGESAFHPQRVPITQRLNTAARYGAPLQDVSLTASDRSHLQGWFARPRNANGDAVILLHGVGDNRQGMMGFAQLFLTNGFAVLVPDSHAHGESGGYFPTYGLMESDDVDRWFDWLVTQQNPKGLTPREAPAAATSNYSERLGWHELGLVDAGRRADLLILAADPRIDISNTRKIRPFILGGAVLDCAALLNTHRSGK